VNSKIKCLILDDELPGLTYLRMLCEQLPFAEVVRCYSQPKKFLEEFSQLTFDVCLLDINMPGITGIEIAQQMKDKPVIFISAHPEFAIDAFELEAIDFIRKPVTRARLEKALLKIQKRLLEQNESQKKKDYFTWNTTQGKSTIYFNEIFYITTSPQDKRDKLAFLATNQQLLIKNITIDKLLELLPVEDFRQVNKSDIVSKKAVQAFTSEEIILKLNVPEKPKFSIALGDIFRKTFTEWM
jgi:two-component system, LytTR family, response regulator